MKRGLGRLVKDALFSFESIQGFRRLSAKNRAYIRRELKKLLKEKGLRLPALRAYEGKSRPPFPASIQKHPGINRLPKPPTLPWLASFQEEEKIMYNEMSCKTCRDRLALYYYGELEPADAAWIREHLKSCSLCSTELDELVKSLQAVVFILKAYDGMDIESIAALFGISPGAVRSHLVRAVETLKKIMHKPGLHAEDAYMPDGEGER